MYLTLDKFCLVFDKDVTIAKRMLSTRNLKEMFNIHKLMVKLRNFLKRFSLPWSCLYTWYTWSLKESLPYISLPGYLKLSALCTCCPLIWFSGERGIVTSLLLCSRSKAISSLFLNFQLQKASVKPVLQFPYVCQVFWQRFAGLWIRTKDPCLLHTLHVWE